LSRYNVIGSLMQLCPISPIVFQLNHQQEVLCQQEFSILSLFVSLCFVHSNDHYTTKKLATGHLQVVTCMAITRGKLLATCNCQRVGIVVDPIVAKYVIRNMAELPTSLLCHVAV
jgi:hypothetical protein